MKHYIVIGGSTGIGLAIVQRLTERGDAVTCISDLPCPVAKATGIVADVTDGEALSRAFSQIRAADALIYCAGVSLAAPVEKVERADFKRLVDTVLTSAIDCCRLAIPLLKESDAGRIVLLGSTGGVMPIPFDSFYSASKAGLIMFSKTLALELPKNIKCTTTIIGGVKTRFSFKRKIYDCAGTPYDADLRSAADKLISIEQTGYSADFVADRIIKITEAEKPPPVVSIGFTKKLMTLFSRLAPDRLLLWIVKRMFFRG